MMNRIFLCSVFLFLVAGVLPVFSEQGHMKLLAVSETPNGYVGGTADLYLEIKPGSGRIFLETFPFTKVDTQMSTRFANEIACDHLDLDCSQYDFFYTLTAQSSIIGGPSAGAAIATLTSAMLLDLPVNENVAVTGTINSGGLIGPVGGVAEKVGAGGRIGLSKILIPKGEALLSNETIREGIFNASRKTEVIEIYTLDEAVYHFTGKKIERSQDIKIDSAYTSTMKVLAQGLCERTAMLAQEIEQEHLPSNQTAFARNLSSRGEAALLQGRHYSAASYCFGANVDYTRLSLISQDLSAKERAELSQNLSLQINEFEEHLEAQRIRTITDLESYMIAKERVEEARDYVKSAKNATSKEDEIANIAWGIERLNSAKSWFQFFGKEGKEYDFDEGVLSTSCALKIAEADERIQYLELFLPIPLTGAKGGLSEAREEESRGNYELCLFKASKAKASVDVVLGVFGVEQETFQEILAVKLERVAQMISEESSKGVFPILGYSYYEYADSLKETDAISALLYAEYALELGNLGMYFEEEKREAAPLAHNQIDGKYLLVLLVGVLIGGVSVFLIRKKEKRSEHKPLPRKKR